jgi:hypothetical protein
MFLLQCTAVSVLVFSVFVKLEQLSSGAVKQRIKSVTNIKKITSAMKMVAASKMRKAQASQLQAQGLPIPFLKMFGEETSAIST